MSVFKEHYGPLDFNKGVWLNADKVESWKMRYSMTIDGQDFELTEGQYETLKSQERRNFEEAKREEHSKLLRNLKYKRDRAIQNSQGQPETIWNYYQGLITGLDQAIALIKGEQK